MVADNHSFDLGMENRIPSANIFALAMDINTSTICMIEIMSHIDELTSEIAKVTSERDQFNTELKASIIELFLGEGLDFID